MTSRDLPLMMFTRDETAQVLRLSTYVVYRLIGSGELRSVMVGGSRRVRIADLVEYMNELEPDKVSTPAPYRLDWINGDLRVVSVDAPSAERAA